MPLQARSKVVIAVVATVTVAAAALVYSQARDVLADTRRITVSSTMSDLWAAQQTFRAREGAYASDVSQLDFPGNEHVEIRIEAGPEAWAAVGWWKGHSDRGCVSSFGRGAPALTTPGGLASVGVESVVCDR